MPFISSLSMNGTVQSRRTTTSYSFPNLFISKIACNKTSSEVELSLARLFGRENGTLAPNFFDILIISGSSDETITSSNNFEEIHYTKNKWAIDVDILIDDSPEKLSDFNEKSVNNGRAICYKQSWNKQCQDSSISIDRLSDIMTRVFG